jgi:valyl-tRNA synthetase
MDMRPQAHDIIRTWLFSSLLRAELESGQLPWKHAALSGWILDPDRKKMSKSKGNVVTPQYLLDRYGADGVRYWAALARPGVDTAFDEGQMKNGKRLAIKLLNASKFALQFDSPEAKAADIMHPLDTSFEAFLDNTLAEAADKLDGFDYAGALDNIERAFWSFCDFYIELAKDRAYAGEGAASMSAPRSLVGGLDKFTRALAPYIPFMTEEVWSNWGHHTSVHRQPWPVPDITPAAGLADPYFAAVESLRAIRSAKSAAKVTVGTPVGMIVLQVPASAESFIDAILDDIRGAARAEALKVKVGGDQWSAKVVEATTIIEG